MVKPLKDLIAEADKFLAPVVKTASFAASDEVSSLADTLAFASQLEEQFSVVEKSAAVDTEFEKMAKAINKEAARIELEVMMQIEQFSKAAQSKGYSEEQVSEALSKIAAAKVKKHLGSLAALGMISPGYVDMNSLATEGSKATGQEKKQLPLSHSFGGAL